MFLHANFPKEPVWFQMHIRFSILNGMLQLLDKSRETYPESSQVLVGGWSSYCQSDDSSGHCTLAFSLSHEPWQSEDQVFLGGIQSTQWVLLEISLNFLRCCSWLCCASFSFCFGTFIQRFASGKMRILEAKCWNMSLDLLVFLMACARKGQDIGQNRMRKVGKRENV